MLARRLAVVAAMKVSTLLWDAITSYNGRTGARDRVSVEYISFPGTSWMVKSNRINLSQTLSMHGGRSSRCFVLKSGTKGL